MPDTEAICKLFKKSKAMVVGGSLPISTQPFTGTFSLWNEKMSLCILISICGETWCKSDIW